MSYQILGRAVKSEHLAIGTLLSTVGLTMAATGGSKEKSKGKETDAPKFESSSKDEADFIKKYIEEAEKEASH